MFAIIRHSEVTRFQLDDADVQRVLAVARRRRRLQTHQRRQLLTHNPLHLPTTRHNSVDQPLQRKRATRPRLTVTNDAYYILADG